MGQAGLFTPKTKTSFQKELPSVSKILFATCDFQTCLVTKCVKTSEQLELILIITNALETVGDSIGKKRCLLISILQKLLELDSKYAFS